MEQSIIDHIRNSAEGQRSWLDRISNPNGPAIKQLITDMEKAFLGEQPMDDMLVSRIKVNNAHEVTRFLEEVMRTLAISEKENQWIMESTVVRKLIHRSNLTGNKHNHYGLYYPVCRFIVYHLVLNKNLDFKAVIRLLHDQAFTDEDIIGLTVSFSEDPFFLNYNADYKKPSINSEKRLTPFGEFLLSLLRPSKGLLGFKKNEGCKKLVDEIVLSPNAYISHRVYWLDFLFDHYPESLEGQYGDFLMYKDSQGNVNAELSSLVLLIEKDARKFEPFIMKAIRETNIKAGDKFSVLLMLNQKLSGKFTEELMAAVEAHLAYYSGTNYAGSYYSRPQTLLKGPLSEACFDFLMTQDAAQGKARIEKLFREATFLDHLFFKYVDDKFGAASVPMLMEALAKDPSQIPAHESNTYYTRLFSILEKYDIKPHFEKLVSFALQRAGKKPRELACAAIAKYVEDAIPQANTLLTGKTVDQRVTGALILSSVGSEKAAAILSEAVDRESNDDTRDIMLEALQETRFSAPYTLAQVRDMIAKAEARKKLDKWNEKWIEEEKLPKLYWKETQAPLAQNDVRFLIYRMKRAEGLNSDIEARQLMHLLDREKSQAFAKAMLTAFQDSNADTRLKYYLTLAGLLGHDDMMHSLNALFKKSITDKRMKMAEYVVGALAMVGTDKALRNVEVIYRKLATKKPAVSKAAHEALTAAATELGITMDELSDRIIPDFGFEGIYKKITVEGEEYRAFINAEFKLNYFTEDNKARKSLPAGAPKELKAEFKEIEKEINEVVKSQSGRLEKFMLEERRWAAHQWKTFFFENPIMFVYALKLIWGVYDQQGKLLSVFYCSEDTSLYDLHDEEVILQEEQFVGIVHPVQLTPETINAWKDKLYAMSMTTIFPIIDRPVITIEEHEKDQNFSKKFYGEAVPKGADFVNTFLVKQQWLKSTGDGGMSEFTKPFRNGQLKAHANIEGPAAFYQGGDAAAKVYEINFIGRNWNEKVALKDVPAVFYSEVMSDIGQLIKAS